MSFLLSSGAINTIPDSGVSRWAFEQDVTDSWGNNDGIDNTSAGYSTDAAVGNYAKSFDGVDDYVDVDDPSSLEDTDTLSVTGWFKTEITGDSVTSIIRHDGHFTALQTNSQGQGQAVAFSGGDFTTYPFNWTYGDNAWHHYAVTYNSTGSNTIYIDASEIRTDPSVGTLDTTTKPWQFGRADGDAEYYDGDLDDIRYYNKELSSTEVSNLYNTGSIDG